MFCIFAREMSHDRTDDCLIDPWTNCGDTNPGSKLSGEIHSHEQENICKKAGFFKMLTDFV